MGMNDREKIVTAIENCIGQPKCKDCPWEDCEYEHEIINSVPYSLMRDVLTLLKEQDEKIAMMRMVYGSDANVVGEIVRCKDCKYYESYGKFCRYDGKYNFNRRHSYGIVCHPDWFCADGERKEE